MSLRSRLPIAFALSVLVLPAFTQEPETTGPLKFSFIHTSDTHINTHFTMPESLDNERSWKAVRTLKDLATIYMTPYHYAAPPPSFIINTGDFEEFGSSGVTLKVVEKYFGDLGIPTYFTLGNHDGTWAPPIGWMQKRYGSLNYSFDFLGVHFIGLDSPGLQDPRPSFGQEAVNFVKNDLAKLPRTTPVIMFFHHPLPGDEFASRYDYDRLLDVAERYNIMLILDGHGHSARTGKYNSIDSVMGGSTFSKVGNTDGYNIVALDGDKIRVAYRQAADEAATKPLLEKKIPERSYHPQIIMNVAQSGTGDARQIEISAEVKQAVYALGASTWTIDDELSGPLKLTGDKASIQVPANKLEPGVHYARFTFGTSEAGVAYDHSMAFAVEHGTPGKDPVAAWRYQTGGGSRSRPLLHKGKLYVGANDGIFYALDAATGKEAWKHDAKSPVTAGPAATDDLIIYGTGDGHLRALTENGQVRWDFETGTAIMGHPLVHEGMVYFASTGATVYCLDASSGQKKWQFDDAKFQVETQPIVAGNQLFFGAWDGNVYSVDLATGRKSWSQPGPRNQTSKVIPQYYAPADADLVSAGGKIFATDRAAKSGSYSMTGDYIKDGPDQAVAFAPASDGKHLYLRRMGKGVAKLDLDMNIVWEGGVAAGSLPLVPVESDGVVYGVTSIGTLYALDAATGTTKWKYHVAPSMYVNVPPTIGNGLIYTIGQDGVVTAVRIPK